MRLLLVFFCHLFFFFKQKTAYEMRISDWSSDVCSSDLGREPGIGFLNQFVDILLRRMAREPGAHGSLVGNDMLGHPRGHAAPPLEIHALRRDFFSPPPLRIPFLEPVRVAGAVFPFILEKISERPLFPGAQGRARLFPRSE